MTVTDTLAATDTISETIADMPIARVVAQLAIAIGEYLTVIVSDADDAPDLPTWRGHWSPAVRAWAGGAASPPNPDRLRFALEVARRLSADHGNSQIHAWFSTVHPAFGEMPARVIARQPLADIREPMLQGLPTGERLIL